ncbi:MAG: 1-acyl-sn-glycerol-3-phosphate acyltransferase [Ruminococcaceae bacterium]|nr:1-acyl-sn-glycerol-3-phosphate acyltransferase [Oscillospiraceae bacterium]
MKIKMPPKSYKEVMSIVPEKRRKPKKPNVFWRTLMKLISVPDLMSVKFECEKKGMEKLSRKQPCLVLMNHSSFIDLEIAASLMFPRAFNIVATTDSFIGKGWLMRQIGCIPTKKFVSELSLIKDMKYTLSKNKSSVIMFPEAGYTFDGTKTTLPNTLGKLCKMLDVPVVMISTRGAFLRDPLYNNLQKRKTKVCATMEYILSPDEIRATEADQIQDIIEKKFDFDGFAYQQENKIKIDEPFRADFLERVLYKCPHCETEGRMLGKGITVACGECGAEYELDEYGYLRAKNCDGKFEHIPDWFKWERECARRELVEGGYYFQTEVDICMAVDCKRIYSVGEGILTQTADGLHLTGCAGEIDYLHSPKASYSICCDFNFYEIGDVIAVGNQKAIYYCFPKNPDTMVSKVRLVAEESYKLAMDQRNAKD